MMEIAHEQIKKAVHGTTQFMVSAGISFFLGFIVKILIVRCTTKEEFGVYSLSIAFVSAIILLVNLGIPEGITQALSSSDRFGKNKDKISLAEDSIQIGVIAGTICCLGILFYADWIALNIFAIPSLKNPLRIVSFVVPLTVYIQIIIGISRGYGLVRSQIIYSVGHPLVFLCLLYLVLIYHLSLIQVVYGIYVCSLIIVVLVISYDASAKLGFHAFTWRKRLNYGMLIRLSFPLFMVNITGAILNWADILMLGRYDNAVSAGGYNVSITLARLLEFPIIGLAFIFLPIAMDLHARDQLQDLTRTYQILTRWLFLLVLPFFIIIVSFPEMVITILFGGRFVDSSIPLRILSAGFMSSTFFGVNGILMVVLGMSKRLVAVNAFGAALNVGLNYLFLKMMQLGATGAAIASMVSIVTMNVLASSFIYHESGIHPITTKYVKAILTSAVLAFIVIELTRKLPIVNVWMLSAFCMFFICIYLASLFLSRSIESEDMALFRAIIARRTKPAS